MIERETKRIVISKEVETRMICDCCGAEIKGPYFSVTTGHYDWGNDSIDSVILSQYCSFDCVRTSMNHYFLSGDGKIYKTAYFDIEKEYFDPNYEEEVEE